MTTKLTKQCVLDAYKKTGLKPKIGAYYYKTNISPGVQKICDGCAAGALYFAENNIDLDNFDHKMNIDIDKYLNDKYGKNEIISFIYGFDNNTAPMNHFDKEHYDLGQELNKELVATPQEGNTTIAV